MGEHRQDVHNVSVDEELVASLGCCGQIHLATGKRCIQPEHHSGSCHFVRPDEVTAQSATSDEIRLEP